jgi:DNA-binding TFAR19-related protein (PDSD5 family)
MELKYTKESSFRGMGDDEDMEAMREQRMAQMRQQQQQKEGKQSEMEEQTRVMMAQILTPEARERCE